MAKGTLNQVTLIGNLGTDPEIRQGANGPIASLSIATTASRKTKDGGYEDITDWHRVAVFGKTAEVADKYLRKGSKVLITGWLRNRKYESNGEVKYDYSVQVESLQLLDRIDNGNSSGGRSEGAGVARGRSDSVGRSSGAKPAVADAPPDFDDDIPF